MTQIDNTDFIKELNEKQVQVFQKFKDTVEAQSQTTFTAQMSEENKKFYLNQNEIIRILLARDFDPKKSLEMWKNWVQWREQNKPETIKEQDIVEELKAGKAFLTGGYDIQKNPILVAVFRRHIPGAIPRETTEKFFIHYLEDALKKARQTGSGRVTIFADMVGYSNKNFSTKDSDLIKKLLSILQDNYPESLGKLIVFKPTWLFKFVYAIVKPFLSKRTKEKIVLLKKEEEILKYISKEELLAEYGGTSTFQYAYPPGSKPLNVLEGKVEIVNEKPENGEEAEVDQNILE
ncbi:divergent CRAL/TRIO domain protein (macronuclear) [Tetrahymena thermophila SB210]|uniref:Divergent CRAL/TRIO domain protein n=1 Tax=Tetrahymena thermophila (strain SB210) TaxID=312017 RepID=Q22HE8_TETTS|nr:divergent CRAL/TRIO domain protein [Tetrahymena thermophila SB210]EAR84753.1 divergent CRAL/TRIO domain protein [Tetrahymena thermophila SB210]|eukprot:XP_001032416.1 divergent CRAL/TRIO domain protein [Tetrahymena thermophila SB210]